MVKTAMRRAAVCLEDAVDNLNLFMMCEAMEESFSRRAAALPEGFHLRPCRKEELELWKAIHFDDAALANQCRPAMNQFYAQVYAPSGDLFFKKCVFVCDPDDVPVGTCFLWKAYGTFTTLHWFKVVKRWEGRGIGRALLAQVMSGAGPSDFPVFLHTQPSSFRAIKLYSDAGFALLTDPVIGKRSNDLAQALPILRKWMLPDAYRRLRFAKAPGDFLEAARRSDLSPF